MAFQSPKLWLAIRGGRTDCDSRREDRRRFEEGGLTAIQDRRRFEYRRQAVVEVFWFTVKVCFNFQSCFSILVIFLMSGSNNLWILWFLDVDFDIISCTTSQCLFQILIRSPLRWNCMQLKISINVCPDVECYFLFWDYEISFWLWLKFVSLYLLM